MSETRWTPGPYKAYSGDDTNGWWVIHDSEGHEIGSTDGGFEFAEAHLFAAAPDLYDALDNLLEVIYGPDHSMSHHDRADAEAKAQAALAKARGKEPPR